MDISFVFILSVLGALCIGVVLTYWYGKSLWVARSAHEEVKNELLDTKYKFESLQAAEISHMSDKQSLQQQLSAEQQLNRQQQEQLTRLSSELQHLHSNYRKEQELNVSQQSEIQSNQSKILQIHNQLAQQTASNKALLQQLESQKTSMQEMLRNNEGRFMKMAEELLQKNSNKLSVHNQQQIQELLSPLHLQIKSFEQRVDRTSKESIQQHSSLKELVKQVSEQSQKVAADANNLAKALKGDFKQQGNWGEMVLQSLLDKSGLEKDREYQLQYSKRDEQHNLLKPDVLIHLPDGKKLIIDSKVSLVAYDSMVAAESQEETDSFQKTHSIAIRNHIDGLSAKNYHDLYKVESPDFVLMFVPIDTALSSALKYNPKLYEYAMNKNIILVSASTLLATLKTVDTLWKNEKQNRNALAIAQEAGSMLEKFVRFAEDMVKMGNQLNTVQKTYDHSMRVLSDGKGNLIRRAQKIKDLGVKSNKSLPEALVS